MIGDRLPPATFSQATAGEPTMRRIVKYVLAAIALFLCFAIGLWQYSAYEDQKNFSAARNDCERGCIQDSGGIKDCRVVCVQHPDHYP
jgi:hypothetical protein